MMKKESRAGYKLALAMLAAVLVVPGLARAEKEEPVQARPRGAESATRAEMAGKVKPRPYDRRLMSEQEWARANEKMRTIKDLRARDAYRQQVHAEMRKRAAAKGIGIPSSPPDWAYCAGSGCLGQGASSRGQGAQQPEQGGSSGVKPQPKPDAIPINIP